MTIIDVRKKVHTHETKHYGTRSYTRITDASIHHSGGSSGNAFTFADYHINTHNWAGIGYHYVILKSGHIQWCGDWNTTRAHVRNHNTISIGICLVGNFLQEPPTREQLVALNELLHYLFNNEKLKNLKNVKGHNEYKGHETNDCPGMNMNTIRKRYEVYNMANLTDKQRIDKLWQAVFGELIVRPPFVNIVYRQKNDRVKDLQMRLNVILGSRLEIDGSFGPATRAVVFAFQAKFAFKHQEFVDEEMWDKIIELSD